LTRDSGPIQTRLVRLIPALLALWALGSSVPARAGGSFHLSVDLGLGYAAPSLPGDSSTPALGFGQAGAQLEFQWKRLIFGAATDYTIFNQYSPVDPNVGNRRGSYFNPVSPELGVQLGQVLLRASFRFLGTYNLDNVNAADQAISYASPLGFGVVLSGPLHQRIWGGLSYSYTQFSQQVTGGTAANLSSPLSLSVFGLLLGWRL
jgi:hypothetical protein